MSPIRVTEYNTGSNVSFKYNPRHEPKVCRSNTDDDACRTIALPSMVQELLRLSIALHSLFH